MYSFFSDHEDVIAAMSTKNDGNMKIKDLEKDHDVIKNRIRFCDKICIPYDNTVSAMVTHGSNVGVVKDPSQKYFSDTDALVTKEKDVYLSVTTADCFPVVFYDAHNNVTGVAHAGWRGIVKEIIPETISAMVGEGARIENIHIEIGPGISQNQFDFELKEMIDEFGFYSQDKYVVPGSTIGKVRVNLQQIIIDQAERLGVNIKNISGCRACTFTDEQYYSARRHGGDSFEAMLTVIGMRS
jgi:YfiH family protein